MSTTIDIDSLRHALADPNSAISSESTCRAVATELEQASRHLVHNMGGRYELVDAFSVHSVDTLWQRLTALWAAVARALDPTPGAAPSGVSENAFVALALGAAKFERNLVAGIHAFQVAALPHGPDVRRAIFNVTTFVRIEDPNFFTLQAVLMQLLCNLVSPVGDEGSELADSQLKRFLSGKRDDDVIIRVLDSRDVKVNVATLHLLNNLTANSPRVMSLLDPEGLKWLSQILGRMDDWLETDDGRFDLATRLIMRLVDRGAQAALFESLSDPDEPITPSQVTLLKLVDASLEPLDRPNPAPSPNAFLLPAWRGLAAYTTASMNSAKDDGRLGAVLAALILATEGLSTIVLAVQTRVDSAKRGAKHIQGGDEAMVSDMKAPPPTGIVPQLVALLGATHAFLPRVKPTKEAPEEPLPFANIKRDLVRLLAALAYDDSAVGDAVRAAQGVELILGMCDTDDRNPYLREYALLCVRNLMKDNPANQAIIAEMDPVGIVGDNGELLPLPERLKKAKAGQAAKETLVEEETV